MPKLFPHGRFCATPGVMELDPGFDELAKCMARHIDGDWGEVSDDDKKLNDLACDNGERLLSAYTVNGKKIWIITEADRSTTTALLPDEY